MGGRQLEFTDIHWLEGTEYTMFGEENSVHLSKEMTKFSGRNNL